AANLMHQTHRMENLRICNRKANKRLLCSIWFLRFPENPDSARPREMCRLILSLFFYVRLYTNGITSGLSDWQQEEENDDAWDSPKFRSLGERRAMSPQLRRHSILWHVHLPRPRPRLRSAPCGSG